MAEESEQDFFLPDLCDAQSILFLVLVAELLVFVLILANSSLVDFSWIDLGLTSLFVQWLVLLSAAVLCNLRPYLAGLVTGMATLVGYGVILFLTLVFSILAEWSLLSDSWGIKQSGHVVRNLIIAAVMTGIAFRYFFLQHQLRKQQQAELNSRIQALQSRIRPHFLFNSMNIIASLISVDPQLAEEVVEDLSVLFRASLNDTSNQPVPLKEELALCEKYVHIESLRLDERLKVDWRINVDTSRVDIPMLTLQPLLENAIYHGIQPLPKGGVVVVDINSEDNMLNLTVTNPVANENHSHEHGNRMALDNTRRRLKAVYGQDASVTTHQDEQTFTTRIRYPLPRN
ncbi:MAG: histidine kinase [Gammaproteobacteria bacterium]|nr:histidine kinase [Gammaproteobacteria bacterium]